MTDSFEAMGLKPDLIEALKKDNITIPTGIQQKVIPEALKGKDIIARSETGTGKTLAYLLPMFDRLNASAREMQALVLVPTHELAIQIQRTMEFLSNNSETRLASVPIIGNVNIDRQVEKLKERPQMIVGSPGRILELIKKRKISAHTIKTIVLDEADRLMDDNNLEFVKAVIKSTLKDRQIMAFSATMSQQSKTRVEELMKAPEFVTSEGETPIPGSIEHVYFLAEQRDKVEVLRKLARILNPERAIVFVNNQGNETELSASKLKFHGLKAESIHGTSRKLDRKKTMEDFRTGKIQLLVASDIAARGLDIEGITHIFSLNLPEDPKDYIHRVGRTGRKGRTGVAVSIITPRELELVKKYEKVLKITMVKKFMYEGKILEGSRPPARRSPKEAGGVKKKGMPRSK